MRKIILLAICLVFVADMAWGATDTFNASMYGRAGYYGSGWTPSANTIGDTGNCVPQKRLSSGTYYSYNGFMYFDTSSIPDGSTISSATLKLQCSEIDNTGGDIDIVIEYYVSSNPPSAGSDWTRYAASTLACNTNTASLSVGSQTNLTLSNVSSISKTGTTGFRFITDNTSAPSSDWYQGFYASGSCQLSVTYTSPPGVPGNPTFSNVANKSMSVSWSAATGATSYKLNRGGSQISASATSPYSDSGLAPHTSYTYRVIAVNADGQTNCAADQSQQTTWFQKKIFASTPDQCLGTYPDTMNGL